MNMTVVVVDKGSVLNMTMPNGNHLDKKNWGENLKELRRFFLAAPDNALNFYLRFHCGYADVDLLKEWGAIEERWKITKGGIERVNILTSKGVNWAEGAYAPSHQSVYVLQYSFFFL